MRTDGSGQGVDMQGPNDAGVDTRGACRKRIRDWQNSRSPERTFGQEERWSNDWRVHSEGLEDEYPVAGDLNPEIDSLSMSNAEKTTEALRRMMDDGHISEQQFRGIAANLPKVVGQVEDDLRSELVGDSHSRARTPAGQGKRGEAQGGERERGWSLARGEQEYSANRKSGGLGQGIQPRSRGGQ